MTRIQEFQQLIDDLIAKQNFKHTPVELYAPIEYVMSQGGKRLRPLLTMLSCDLFNGQVLHALYPALAIEVFHNFTLVHDDIMDKAPIRRGMQTVFKKWNADIAILSGDTMFAMAYQFALKTDPLLIPEILGVFSKAAIEVCEGQQLDMNYEGLEHVSIDEYIHMITHKTAVLLGASLKIGAIVANAPANSIQNIYDFGINMGIAFQLKDDLLDVYGIEQKFGKMSGGDIAANKKTYLYIKARELANQKQSEELSAMYSGQYADTEEKINRVKVIYDDLNIEEHVSQAMAYYYEKSLEFLELTEASPDKKMQIKDFADHLYKRNH
ncbi:MAG: isoprenyl synthetase [Bacteroidetes bacterium HGW-Bacteroidetes-1]|jgi:geranylgeranyl diphosphate synthase type II|nr:MAG: isoprenyl synthetase [Bacteroidetes bacterium HGW-Bacteroidetes-1]